MTESDFRPLVAGYVQAVLLVEFEADGEPTVLSRADWIWVGVTRAQAGLVPLLPAARVVVVEAADVVELEQAARIRGRATVARRRAVRRGCEVRIGTWARYTGQMTARRTAGDVPVTPHAPSPTGRVPRPRG
jgi:hypothetical protein